MSQSVSYPLQLQTATYLSKWRLREESKLLIITRLYPQVLAWLCLVSSQFTALTGTQLDQASLPFNVGGLRLEGEAIRITATLHWNFAPAI